MYSAFYRTIPPYLDWLSYLSWFKYSFEALSINQWMDWGNDTILINNIPITTDIEIAVLSKLGFDAVSQSFMWWLAVSKCVEILIINACY